MSSNATYGKVPGVRTSPGRRRGLLDAGGNTAVEFAILAPLLLTLLFAVIVYGGYFMMSHALQQIANDAARASIGGLSDPERQQLALQALSSEEGTYSFLKPSALQLDYAEVGQTATVQVTYDASSSPLWALRGLLPLPASTIVRSASIQLGGY
jgi:Flp pilus assembly protein TadG